MVKLSVVMAVYNGASRLEASVDSILGQSERDLELIVVDDGSTDEGPAILNRIAGTDQRLRIVSQENLGLTRALIRGCAEARASIIARQDCGDISHPERLRIQYDLLASDPSVTVVSCATRVRAPEGEPLFLAIGDEEEVRRSLREDGVDTIRGLTHHGSAMFPRETYQQAGGYRPQFYFAQDLDLWIRMAALGRIVFSSEVLYEASIDADTISATRRREQIASAEIAIRIRDEPANEALLLAQAERIRPNHEPAGRLARARSLYFIASCLRSAKQPAWRAWAMRSVRAYPLYLRAWVLLVRGS